MTDEQQLTAAGNEMSASFLAAKKRSDETLAKLEAKPSSFTMLTGDRPTGRLHLGHYFGSIRERVAMQERGVNTNIIIADYQVITDRDTTEHIQDNVLNLVLDYMAAGIDPNKTMMFTHSAVPAENQLLLPFLSLVTEAELHRNPTVKSEMEASGHALTGLLLTYPVHQACDILFCKANVVPIGKDNLPHVEITRTIARRFNERYAKKNPVFPEPSAAMLRELGMEGVKSMKGLGTAYPQLSGYYPYPKPLMNPRLLSIQQLCGIYSPFTIEANYNREMPYYNIPHTICHELSHLKGFMREDEANFIGYLACIGSDSPDFRYSGYLTGWVYAGNALAKADLEAYYGLYGRLAPEAARDLAWNNQFWDRFDGKVAEASTQLNDRYLKANNQEDGVRSYGRMVDLMLAYYRDSQ